MHLHLEEISILEVDYYANDPWACISCCYTEKLYIEWKKNLCKIENHIVIIKLFRENQSIDACLQKVNLAFVFL